jgi:hypothetical protein
LPQRHKGANVAEELFGSCAVNSHVANLHHGAIAIEGGIVRRAWPVSADSKVEDEIERRVGKCSPNALVAKVRAGQSVVCDAVEVPGDNLCRVARAVSAVDGESPRMPAIVGDCHSLAQTGRLVANTAWRGAAVGRAVARQDAVERLHDVELATLRPPGAVSNAVAHHPKGRPDALFVGLRVGSESDLGLHLHDLAGRGRETGNRLDTSRRPRARRRLARHELQRVTTAGLDVVVRRGVDLDFVVGVHTVGESLGVSLTVLLCRTIPDRAALLSLYELTNLCAMFHSPRLTESPALPVKVSDHTTL